ncbi:pyrroloquinoline-quinone synthase PqqC [Limnochorda pilosa]|uniref:Pyrroloquinoline-quinone synthase n=1 Tax=Limnochorda pilosa TaxID=1555112 RepID=A0A0K2SJG1_LIMPI|nr:pyrroloquinoline-quinone synthase PqqC [Limnochorda pilosa]BAS26994.1 pyrroloquinoline quinone biosynthesis protein PqqC [Limnochorda pilosa]
MEAPWSREEFVDRLRAVGEAKYHDKHPFHVRMHRGELSPPEVRGWIANRFYYQKMIPVKDALILSKLPNREDRRRWIQRILDHDGRGDDEGGIEAWLRLGEAAGIPRAALLDERHVVPGVRFAVDAYVHFCRLEPWWVAVASSLTELFAPDLVARRIRVFEEHYPWVRPEGLAYFRQRLHQAPRDAEHGLELVVRAAPTRADQERTVAALSFKCDVLWALLDAVERAGPA